jgi:hypothetical protein
MVGKIVTTVIFVALIGWDLWEATGNMIGLPGFYEALSVGEDTPWFLLIPGVVIPVVVLAAGLWWGWRRRSVVESAVVYALALAVQSSLALSLIAAEQAWRADVLINSLQQ